MCWSAMLALHLESLGWTLTHCNADLHYNQNTEDCDICLCMRAHLLCRRLDDLERRMEQVHAAVVHLDSQMHLMACFNVEITIGTQCVLPMLQVGWECLVPQAGSLLL